jgi:bacillithiol biosynthesis deacetylase BshB1
MKILAFGPHPDDVEFGCAPVLLKEIQKGNEVRIIVLSRGEAGTSGTPEIREAESRAAAKLMGAAIDVWDFGGDCHIRNSPENAFRMAEEIRTFRPEIVLAPETSENQHPDHVTVGRLVRDACRFARYGGLEELRRRPVHKISALYFYNITQHAGGLPDIVMDITGVRDQWEAVMECHQSQVTSRGYVDLQMTAARLLGLTIGVDYAIGLYRNEMLRVDYLSDLTLSSRNF